MDQASLTRAWSSAGLSVPPTLYAEVPSTQDIASASARDGFPAGTTVVASRQTAGRGRRGRRWATSSNTSLAFSVVLRPGSPVSQVGWIPLAVAVACREAWGEALRIKWPNDLLVEDGRKVAGVLAEAETSEGQLEHVVVGVGANLSAIAGPPGSAGLDEVIDGPLAPEALIAGAVAALLRWVGRPLDDVRSAWMSGCAHDGQWVRVGALEGVSGGLAPDGGLRLVQEGGRARVVYAGDVEMVCLSEGIRATGDGRRAR